MKTLFLLLASAALALAQTPAAGPAPSAYDNFFHGNVSVEGQVAGGGRSGSKMEFHSTHYSDVINAAKSTRTVEVTLRAGGTAAPATVTCYFVLHEHGKPPCAASAGDQESPTGSGTLKFSMTSEIREKSFASTGINKRTGEEINGWLVRVVRDGHIVGVAGSDETYIAWAKDPAVLAQHLKK